jgi:hypothetical protein
MVKVLVVCHDCKKDIRPLKGDKYSTRIAGGKYRPICMACHKIQAQKRARKLRATDVASSCSEGLENTPTKQEA